MPPPLSSLCASRIAHRNVAGSHAQYVPTLAAAAAWRVKAAVSTRLPHITRRLAYKFFLSVVNDCEMRNENF